MSSPFISILTATFNAEAVLPGLIASLQAQTDTDFEWVVVDGGSDDHSVALVRASGLARVVVVSEPDFGIYDALNKSVKAASGDYYLVLGADDLLEPEAVRNYRHALTCASLVKPDIVTALVRVGEVVVAPRPGKAWLYGLQGYVSSHAVGCLIRKSLHVEYGYYSRRFPIAADQYFIKKAVIGGAQVLSVGFVAGEYGSGGTSSIDVLGTLSEVLRVQLLTESSKLLQLMLFFLRVLKNYRRL